MTASKRFLAARHLASDQSPGSFPLPKLAIHFTFGLWILGAFSFPSFASEVFIPQDLAGVRDRAEGTNGKTILIIEEAHVDYAAQKALSDILKDLIEHESLHDVLVEGGWGDVTLTSFKNLADPVRRKEVAEHLEYAKKLAKRRI